MSEPRVYKNSPATLILIIFVFVVLFGIIALTSLVDIFFMLFSCGFGVLFFLFIFFRMASKVIISDDEITSKTILGSRTLRWTEITSASGKGKGVQLHGDQTTVSIHNQIPGFEEIVEVIGEKRSDLFSAQEFGDMKRGFTSYLEPLGVSAFFIGIFITSLTGNFDYSPFFTLLVVVGILFVYAQMFISNPQSVTIENNTLQVRYLVSGEKSFSASEVASVHLTFSRTRRGGKNYYVSLNAKDGQNIRIAGMNYGLPIVYLTLKNWQRQHSN